MVYNVQAGLVLSGNTTTELAGLRRGIVRARNALARFQSVCKAYTTGTLLTKGKRYNIAGERKGKTRNISTLTPIKHTNSRLQIVLLGLLMEGGQ